MSTPIYLDHHATTPVAPEVLEAMLPSLRGEFGNPASRSHAFGWRAHDAVEDARAQVAALIGASAKELVFTSGATEAIHLALAGVTEMHGSKGRHVVTTRAEHRAVLDTCAHLERGGFEVTYLDVDSNGAVSRDAVADALRPDTILVSVLWGNNEVGTLNPIRAIGELCHAHGVLFFTDATQAVGHVPVDVRADAVDLLSISAHKLYGPKGAGALYVRRRDPRVRLAGQVHGGGHERGLRSGTLNVPGIVGLGAACALASTELEGGEREVARLRDRLEAALLRDVPRIHVHGDRGARLPGNLNVGFEGVEAEALLLALEGVALSSGSACSSASPEPSHVLRAMGVPPTLAHGSIRFGVGRGNTEAEIDAVAARLAGAVALLRNQTAGAP